MTDDLYSDVNLDACQIPQERYRVFIEDVADGFFETDLAGNFQFFNDALCRIFGHTRQEIDGHSYSAFMDAPNAKFAYESFNRIFNTGLGVTDITWEIIRKDGSKRILEISATLIVEGEGRKVGFRGIARDITDKYNFQLALEKSEQRAQEQYLASRRAELRYQAFLEFLPEPVFVFNMDSTVSYLNPAFERVFGWTFEELKGKRIPFVPDDLKEATRKDVKQFFKEGTLHHYATKRLTKAGRLLDIIIDGAIFHDDQAKPAGQVITLRDVTREKRAARINQALFRIAQSLYQFRKLDERLEYITRQIQQLLDVEGASVILLDEENMEFYFRVTAYEDLETGMKMREIRFPVNEGVAGEVYRTGRPLIVEDAAQSPFVFKRVDEIAGYQTRSMLDVPLQIDNHMIGVLCAVNKKEEKFDNTDVELLSTIASMVALPIENARINDELQRSYEEVKSYNRAKDRVIHHLSHELKTPVSVLAASLNLLNKKVPKEEGQGFQRILDRAHRNLNRILDMQYQIEDIIKEKHHRGYHLLSTLLDACTDELEALAADECGQEEITSRIRQRIEDLFSLQQEPAVDLRLDEFVAAQIDNLRSRFAHRTCRVEVTTEKTPVIHMPRDVLAKIVEGLLRNAVENTPDGGLIEVSVLNTAMGPELKVKDYGIGISAENQRLIFDNYFTAYEPLDYASRQPYDFQAGGKGFDLLRMKIFSERYNFDLEMSSKRCRHLINSQQTGPGDVALCDKCHSLEDCLESGGTTVVVRFHPAGIDKQT
jgi:PAS domain S-box-containing protein